MEMWVRIVLWQPKTKQKQKAPKINSYMSFISKNINTEKKLWQSYSSLHLSDRAKYRIYFWSLPFKNDQCSEELKII